MIRTDWKSLGILTLFASFILFFVSQDSYLCDLHSRVDSAWMFMCGKAWMNGLVPYVDFSDSKGPLLYLIYGLGYLLQPTNYLGVFWISCIWYGLTFFFTYKIAGIFLNDNRFSLSCSIIMALAFFNPWFHNETRAEDFCLLFMNLSLYRVCLIMYEDPVSRKTLLSSFAILGFCFGALLLIKYSIAAMQAGFILCALVVLVNNKQRWWKPFLWGLCGFCVITLPFIICFLIQGNLIPFVHEYFIRTIQTVHNIGVFWSPGNVLLTEINPSNPFLTYLLEWADLVYTPEYAAIFILLMLGGLLFLKRRIPYRWMPLFMSFWVFAFTVRHHTYYYFNICSFLLVFLLIGLSDSLPFRFARKTFLTAVLTALVLIPSHMLAYTFKALIFNKNTNQNDFYRVSYVMSQVEKPKLVNAYDYEHGFGILTGALPAGKYWVRQNGMTPEMMHEHEELILSGTADFIILNTEEISEKTSVQVLRLTDLGYKEYLRFGESSQFILFSIRQNLEVKDYATPPLKALFLKSPRRLLGKTVADNDNVCFSYE